MRDYCGDICEPGLEITFNSENGFSDLRRNGEDLGRLIPRDVRGCDTAPLVDCLRTQLLIRGHGCSGKRNHVRIHTHFASRLNPSKRLPNVFSEVLHTATRGGKYHVQERSDPQAQRSLQHRLDMREYLGLVEFTQNSHGNKDV